MHLLSSAVRLQPVRRSERCALRPGNVHSADGWENVLKPVVARIAASSRAFIFGLTRALPIQTFRTSLKPSGSICDPIAGEPHSAREDRPFSDAPNEVRRSYANFTYRAGSWTKPRRVVAKVEWHSGELYLRVGLARPAETSLPFTTSAAPASKGSRKEKARSSGRGCHAAVSLPTPSVSSFMRSRIILAISCARWRRRSQSKTCPGAAASRTDGAHRGRTHRAA
jgi:hypothetical protein